MRPLGALTYPAFARAGIPRSSRATS